MKAPIATNALINRYDLPGWDRVHVQDLLKWATELADTPEARANGIHAIIDMRAVRGFGVPTPYAISVLRRLFSSLSTSVKIALLVNDIADTWMHYTFMGVRQPGVQFQIFTDEAAAQRWLITCDTTRPETPAN